MAAARRAFPVALMIALVLGCGIPAAAATLPECKAAIDRITVKAGPDFDNVTEERLNENLEEASLALVQAKPADSLPHLKAFQAKVIELRDAKEPKIPKGSAAKLLEGVQKAIECLETLKDR